MELPFSEIFAIVRRPERPQASFEALRNFGESQIASPIWKSIKSPDVEKDIEAARLWLHKTTSTYRPTGVYLGLDTLNERNGKGTNIEIGMTTSANPAVLSMDWAYHCEEYGKKHLIRGVYEVHKAYKNRNLDDAVHTLADYLFFFGYSGIVLASALERMTDRWDSLYVWGFHDGDIGFLAKCSRAGVQRLATFDGK